MRDEIRTSSTRSIVCSNNLIPPAPLMRGERMNGSVEGTGVDVQGAMDVGC